MKKGFTLIELLVVITLIGILAIAVLSALNPIEQINKARDARKRADSAQILQAIDRYFASNEKFPWNNYADPGTNINLGFGASAHVVGVGVCGQSGSVNAMDVNSTETGCSQVDGDEGFLIATEELKNQFTKRDYFKVGDAYDDFSRLWIFKEDSDPSVNVCFVPSSKATQDTWDAIDGSLKDLSFSGDEVTALDDCDTLPDWASTSIEGVCFVCLPEE